MSWSASSCAAAVLPRPDAEGITEGGLVRFSARLEHYTTYPPEED